MLTKIREKTQGIIATFILVLLVIPFALWGINSYFEGGIEQSVAKVEGDEISQNEYRAALDQFRGRLDPKMLDSRSFKELVLSGLIDQALLVRDAEGHGYRLGDARLAQLIREVPLFQRDGRFDPEQYRALLRREGLTEHDFESRLRAENMTRQVQTGFAESGIVTAPEIDTVARLMAQQRELAWLIVSPDPFLARVRVSDEEIEKFYEANPDQFKTPEQARAQYLRLSIATLAKKYQPTEAELKRAYEEEAARYTTPEKRRVSHILIPLEEQAPEQEVAKARVRLEDIARQLRAGADFAKLARQHSQDPESAAKGGDLGELRPGMLPRALETAVSDLKQGEVSAPVRTPYGLHLAKLTAHTPAKRRPLDQVRAELETMLRKRVAEERFIEYGDKLRNLVYENPDSLEPAARALDLSIEESGWLSRSGGAGIGQNVKAIEALFVPEVLNRSRNSDVVELDGETLVALRAVEHRPAARRPLTEVRAQIERQLRQQAANREAQRLVAELREALRAGQDTAALARQHGLKREGPRRIARDERGVDRRILEQAFRLPSPPEGQAAYESVELGSQGYALVELRKVIEPDPAKIEPAVRERARRLLTERRGTGYYDDYRAALRAGAEIQIFRDNL